MSNLKFFEFRQNNSGGSFDTDDVLCARIVIEAPNAQAANHIAQSKGIYFNGCDTGADCECCGDRWYAVDNDDAIDLERMSRAWDNKFNTISDYVRRVSELAWTKPAARIFYMDGRVEEVNANK